MILSGSWAWAENGIERDHAWSEETLRLFSTLPVQEGGRLKPLSTFAGFKMLKFYGKRTMRFEVAGEEVKLSPVEWILDCFFYPELAKDYPSFDVLNSDVIGTIGATPHEKKRGQYSYRELEVARHRLFEMAQRYGDIDSKQRTVVQTQVLNLAHNVHEFEMLIHFMDFARHDFSVSTGKLLAAALPDKDRVSLSDVIQAMPAIQRAVVETRALADEDAEDAHEAETKAFEDLYGSLDLFSRTAGGIALIPPTGAPEAKWSSPSELIVKAFDSGGSGVSPDEVRLLAALESLPGLLGSGFDEGAKAFHLDVTSAAKARGEYGKVALEDSFYRGKYFFWALFFYIVSFILVAVGWLAPGNRVINKITPIAVVIPTGFLILGITLRCIIQGRPPVTTLYETILFITSVSIVVALFMEFVNRKRIALAVASVLGVMGMFLANRYELKDGLDTMPSLQAVLDTNFWLSTHVTTVAMGYAAGLLAGAVSHVYIFGKLFGFKKSDKVFYKTLSRMIYGIVCFGLLFSVVGTVLGGIWANYSWGRFWGWDPKENGALMIVLWNLVILHCRMGGYARDLGVAMLSVFGGMIVAFSWWGVNLLGVGLHAYGFISGVMNMLILFWSIQSLVILGGAIAWFRGRSTGASATKHATA